jgi:hypothetical protein
MAFSLLPDGRWTSETSAPFFYSVLPPFVVCWETPKETRLKPRGPQKQKGGPRRGGLVPRRLKVPGLKAPEICFIVFFKLPSRRNAQNREKTRFFFCFFGDEPRRPFLTPRWTSKRFARFLLRINSLCWETPKETRVNPRGPIETEGPQNKGRTPTWLVGSSEAKKYQGSKT